jgi:hypothetical protein
MDSLVFEESIQSDAQESEFLAKKWAYVNDNNSGNYSNQVVIDTTPLANAGQYVGWNEGYILMPLVVQLTADTAANLGTVNSVTGTAGDQTWAFKNGFWQMLHSMSVEFNNGGVVGLYPFLNVFASFKAQTSFSDADVFNHGDGIGFFMDTADSWSYQNDTQPSNFDSYYVLSGGDGVGLCNNKNYPPTSFNQIGMAGTNATYSLDEQFITPAQATINYGADNIGYFINQTSNVRSTGKPYPSGDTLYNEGMRKRQIAVNRNTQSVNVASGFSTGYLGQEQLMPISSLNDVWATHQLPITTAGVRAWNIYAKLRLKDLADFFHKVPLLKGATLRFIMNTNQAITSFQTSNITMADPIPAGTTGLAVAGGFGQPLISPLIATTRVNIVGGMTNPLMLSSSAVIQGTSSLVEGSYKLSVSIVKCNFTEQSLYSGLSNTALQSCRLYAPLYTFTPAAERRYLSLKTKTITYKDVMSYQFTGIPSQSNFNILVSQGLKNICSVLVVPLLASTANGPLCMTAETATTTGSATWGTPAHPSTLMSPFSTTGATPDPVIFNNFNVLIQGVPAFLMDEMYDFEAFKHQLMSSNQLNGNLTTGLTSGLISERMFSYLYRYYYADCCRKLPAERDTDRSIQVRGRNLCTTAVDLLVFIEVEKTIVVDLETGARVA